MTDDELVGRTRDPLPKSVILSLASGYLGMSVLINLVNTLLVFFYLPPKSAGLPTLVTDRTVLGILTAVALIAAFGRITDSLSDPFIAGMSDRCTHHRGRRIPFMAIGMIPAAICATLMFIPLIDQQSGWNIVWLVCLQAFFYISLTAYVTPSYALVVDLGRNADERLRLSTATSIAWAGGIVVASMVFFIAPVLDGRMSTIRAWQTAVFFVCLLALFFLAVPVFTIDEPRWAKNEPSATSVRASLRAVFRNEFFRHYAAADFAYFGGLAIMQTGLLYYVTVLLELEAWVSALLLLVMVVLSAGLIPLVARAARSIGGGKQLMIFALLVSTFVFLGSAGLGLTNRVPYGQAALLIALFSVPFSILSVMPQWILSNIADHAAATGGEAQAAMYYAARAFLQKLATTLGVVMFAALLQFGRDAGDDLGIRLTGLGGAILYLLAALLFSRYDEGLMQAERNVPSD